MFSKELFKQSAKANGIMWIAITFLSCFMLACVMLISNSGMSGSLTEGVTDTIIDHEIEAMLQRQALDTYDYVTTGEEKFDEEFAIALNDNVTLGSAYATKVSTWISGLSSATTTGIPDCKGNIDSLPKATAGVAVEEALEEVYQAWAAKEPTPTDIDPDTSLPKYDLMTPEGIEKYRVDVTTWLADVPGAPAVVEAAAAPTYEAAINKVTQYFSDLAKSLSADPKEVSLIYQKMFGSFMITLNPFNYADSSYTDHDLEVPADYDITSIITHYGAGDVDEYLSSSARVDYRGDRAVTGAAVFLATMFTTSDAKASIINALAHYGIDEEKYDSFGYDFAAIMKLSIKVTLSYQSQYAYQSKIIANDYANGKYESEEKYQEALASEKEEIKSNLSTSFMALLPSDIATGLNEIGKMDIYGLIVSLVFFKMAGLLLPIIYIIMCANNLISSQVDTGSMAYVLSTSTKRNSVTATQIAYLLISLFAMCLCTMLTSFVCFALVDVSTTTITYGKLALLSLGMFITLAAIAGLNFMTSCFFNRQKHSMSLGGGISIFFLVATMLGLFGLKQFPSITRLESLNYFNYVSLISLFDVSSVVDGTTTYIWKLAILVAFAVITFTAGSLYFKKKDLPL